MAPSILLPLPALFFSLVLLMITSHRIMDPTSTILAISQATDTICGITAGSQQHSIKCKEFKDSAELNSSFKRDTTLSTNSIPGSHNFICSLRSGDTTFCKLIKCVFSGPTVSETSVRIRHLEAIHGDWLKIIWWRSYGCNHHARPWCNFPTSVYGESHSLTSGDVLSCRIYGAYIVQGWGSHAKLMQRNLAGVEMSSLTEGGAPMCSLNRSVSTKILPGGSLPDESFPSCGVFHDSGNLCCGSSFICKRSDTGTKESCPIPAIIEMPHAPSQGKWWLVYVILGIVLAIVGIGMNVCYEWLKLRKKINKCIPTELSFPALNNVKVFSFDELNNATNNFSRDSLLGCGGFGIVYSGQLSDGRLVAVKLCYTTDSGWESCFKAELETLATTCHVNVVSLIGYCTENKEPLCVFELMPNKDLHRHIHPRNWQIESTVLLYSWKLRLKVLLDVARGIEYLHRYAKPRIIHRDIKSSNILLDEKWNAKISDFGLAVFGPEPDRDHVDVAAVIGTAGYLDPDCDPYFPFVSQQNDVYSFGVVMLEMVTGQRAYNTSDETQLAPFAAPKIARGKLMDVLDKRLVVPVGRKMEAVEIVAQLALQCTRSGSERPNMSEVVTILESAVALFN